MSRRPTLTAVVKMYVDPEFGKRYEDEDGYVDELDITISWERIPQEMTGVGSEEGVLYFYKVLVNEWGEFDAKIVDEEVQKITEYALSICPTVSEKDNVVLSLGYW